MLINAACKSALTLFAVVASGNERVATVPLIVGGEPPQSPNPPGITVTPLHWSRGFSTTLPFIRVAGAVGVLVTPAVAAIPYEAARPRITDDGVTGGITCAATMSVAGLEVMLPNLAVMIVWPTAIPVARPVAGLTVASRGLLDDQVDDVVITAVDVFENVAVALYCCVVATKMVLRTGVMAMVVSDLTFNVAGPEVLLPRLAVMVVVPDATPVARPLEVIMVAKPVLLDDHVTNVVITAVVLSAYVPVATYCWVAVTGIV